MSNLASRLRFDATNLQDLVAQLNAFIERLQTGSVVLGGLRLDVRSSVPTKAPESSGSPHLIVVNVSGTLKLYLYDGTSWVAVGTQT